MVEILKHTEGDESPFIVQAHPVTRVYCDEEGIVCYERSGAEPIRLNQVAPKRSRQSAKERLFAIMDMSDEYSVERDFPISTTGYGLTCNQLKMQTVEACLKSRDIEAERFEAFKKKQKRFKN